MAIPSGQEGPRGAGLGPVQQGGELRRQHPGHALVVGGVAVVVVLEVHCTTEAMAGHCWPTLLTRNGTTRVQARSRPRAAVSAWMAGRAPGAGGVKLRSSMDTRTRTPRTAPLPRSRTRRSSTDC